MDRRYAVVNLSTDQIVRRETLEQAEQALRGIEDAGHTGFAVDGRTAEVVAASRIPFRLDVERGAIVIAGVGLSMDTLTALRGARVPCLVVLDRADDLLTVRDAIEFQGIDVEPEALVIDGIRYARDALKALAAAKGELYRIAAEDGVVTVALEQPVPEEHVTDIIVPPKEGTLSELPVQQAPAPPFLALVPGLPSEFPGIEVRDVMAIPAEPLEDRVRLRDEKMADSRHKALTQHDLADSKRRRMGLSDTGWNELLEADREKHTLAELEFVNEAAKNVVTTTITAATDTVAASESPAKPAATTGADASGE